MWCELLPKTGCRSSRSERREEFKVGPHTDQAAGWGRQQVFRLLKETNTTECVMKGKGVGARETEKGLPARETGKGQFLSGSPVCPPLSWGNDPTPRITFYSHVSCLIPNDPQSQMNYQEGNSEQGSAVSLQRAESKYLGLCGPYGLSHDY